MQNYNSLRPEQKKTGLREEMKFYPQHREEKEKWKDKI